MPAHIIKTLVLGTAALAAPALAQDFTPEQVESEIALARSAFADIHPGYDRFTDATEIKAGWDAIIDRARAEGGLDIEPLYLGISETLARIRCDHTKAELPKSLKDARKTSPVYLPFKWDVVEGRAIILDPAGQAGLSAGDEILSVDGRTIASLRERLHPYISIDGYTDHTRDTLFAASTEHMGGALDHFGALLWDVPRTATLDVRGEDGTLRTVAVDRVGHEAWLPIATSGRVRNFKDAVDFRRIGDDAAILSIDTFVNYRQPVDPQTLYGPVFAALKAEGRDTLILDIRRNGGGSSDAARNLFANLISEPTAMRRREIMREIDHSAYTDYISTWDDRVLNPPIELFTRTETGEYAIPEATMDTLGTVAPAPDAFDGELIVLTSRDNSSGSTNLISLLDEHADVTLVGETTGGNPLGATAGVIFFLNLPESGITLRLPAIRSELNVGNRKPGQGMAPDIAAPVTVDSLREGRDPAMDAALALVSN